jgi:hypothetical protein
MDMTNDRMIRHDRKATLATHPLREGRAAIAARSSLRVELSVSFTKVSQGCRTITSMRRFALALLAAMALAIFGCGGNDGPTFNMIGVAIKPGGAANPNYFSAPVDSTVVFVNQDVVGHDVSFDSPVGGSASLVPGGTARFRMPSSDPGYPISFGVSNGSGGSVSIY